MLTSIVLYVIAGVGAFLIIFSYERSSPKRDLERMEELRKSAKELQLPDSASFLGAARKGGLALALARSDLNVTPAVFIRDSIMFAVIAFAIGYFISSGLLVGFFAAIAGIFIYFYVLNWRSASRKIEYEGAVGSICDRIATGAMLNQTLHGAMIHAATNAPEILKSDFEQIASQLSQGASIEAAFADVVERRKCYSLQLLANTLAIWHRRGTTLSLQEVIKPLSDSIKKRKADGKRMHAELTGARITSIVAGVSPPALVLLFRILVPDINKVYAELEGQLIQIIAYVLTAVGFMISQRRIQDVQRMMDIGTE